MTGLAVAMAWAGGLMLVALIGLTCASILGRELNEVAQGMSDGPLRGLLLDTLGVGAINGDFELLEAGIAFAIFAFLPLAHVTGAHASVDIFADRFGPRTDRAARALTEVVFAAVLVLIAVQLWGGLESKLRSGQTTLRLQFPLWWSYALAMVPAALAALVACWMAAMRLREMVAGRAILPAAEGADH
ncbi:TRAP transporter small permease [Jannaschia sp. Os4]|uniref:TRAP transporter small permease n=1 Tax=Jannaschia sp. Os4 TaxID=2807617 RepID=UPI0031B5679C